MGNINNPSKVKFFCGLIYNKEFNIKGFKNVLEKLWGKMDIVSDPIPFTYTEYYNEEMGVPLFRILLSFEELVDREILAQRKIESNEIENNFLINGKRQLNIDPGYFTLGQLILASTKDRDQRIYIGNGIFAEVTLRYSKNKFHAYPWTYRDYASPEYEPILLSIRNKLYAQTKQIS